MPTAEHEGPVALASLEPDLMGALLSHLFHLKIPDYDHARTQPTDVRVMVPRTYHADGMVVFCDPDDRPLLASVLEIQRGRDAEKLWRWKLYVAQLETELASSTALVVFCPQAAVARWYRDLVIPDGFSSLPLQPLIFTPEDVPLVTDAEVLACTDLTLLETWLRRATSASTIGEVVIE